MRWRLAAAALAIAALAVALAVGWLREPPRIVLVVLDTVRADALPPWGAPAHRAPWIADLARRSVVFRHAYSTSSWTAPSTASIFTGQYPPEHGVTEGFRAQQRAAGVAIGVDRPTITLRPLPTDRPTLAERLRDAGWRNLGVANNLNIGPELGFDRGFERFRSDRHASADALANALLGWALEDPGRPTFLYLHLNEAHHPYVGHAPWYVGDPDPLRDARSRYASEVAWLDAVLERLAVRLAWDEDTAIVLVSDHGEAFGEHGHEGHTYSLYGEVNRVAMLVHAPWRAGPALIDANASLVDVLPTVLDLAGLPAPEGPGRSLLALARAPADERVLFAHRTSPQVDGTLWAAIRGRWKLLAEHGASPRAALYDLAADPGETVDRSAEAPEVAAELAAALERFRATTGAPADAVRIPLDDETVRHLEELGYVEP